MTRVDRVIAGRAVRYAVGEILLIVVGVTLALTANSWYEGVKERRDELLALQQLKAALETDIQQFSEFRTRLHGSERRIGALREDPYFRNLVKP